MYKRYVEGDQQTTSLGGIITFAVLVCCVVWLVPVVVLTVTEMPMEIFMIPPIWRGDIMCQDGTNIQQYTYVDGVCTAECEPGEPCVAPHGPVSAEQVRINLEKARQGLGLYDIYQVGMLVLQYGSIVCIVCSAGVMRIRTKHHVHLHLGIILYGLVLCILYLILPYDTLLPYGVGVMVVAYVIDMYSTARFGDSVRYREANPILRRLFAVYTIRRALALHTGLYCTLLVGVTILFGTGPFPIHGTMGILLFSLAACHLYCGINNLKIYKEIVQ